MTLEPRTLLQNRYRITLQLGQGGMGTVYQAIDERLDTTVALKETHFTDPRMRKQFEREARLLAKLRHPALPKVIDHFTEDAGQFLVMEFIAGEDLYGMLRESRDAFEVSRVLKWGDQLLDALSYLHRQEPPIIHRDIKPQNLKLSDGQQVILLDFGLAKQFGESSTISSTNRSIFGYTPNYAPIEQIQGSGTDPRTDIYSLAATLYHLVTNAVPPDVLTRLTATSNGDCDPLRPACEVDSQVPSAVSNVLTRGMAIGSNQRFQSADEMKRALAAACAAIDTAASAPTIVPRIDIENKIPLTIADLPPTQRSEESMPTIPAPQVRLPLDGPHSPGSLLTSVGRSKSRILLSGGLVLLLALVITVAALSGKRARQPNYAAYGRLGRPLRVGVMTWPGYAGGIVANNGFKPNKDCLYWTKYGQTIEFLLLDDIKDRNYAFRSGGVDIVWSTVDLWANELPGFVDGSVKARAIMQVDWSRGGDAIVVDKSIQTVEELKGKKISLVLFTPQHWLLEAALENSGLEESDQSEIIAHLIGKRSTADARSDFVTHITDAAVVREPDVTEALQRRPNAHVLVSTQTAQNLIADVMVAREDFIKEHPDVIKAFIQGWFDGTADANRNPDKAVRLLMDNEPHYKDLGEQVTRADVATVKWADLPDNTQMFGLDGSDPLFDRIFKQAGAAWVKRGYINRGMTPDQAKDVAFLKEIYAVSPVPASTFTTVKPESK
jgi:serine/threonine protein kinase/ABC-type nitrate/sulfonate/bicarbonate transport system substrate-binding protein